MGGGRPLDRSHRKLAHRGSYLGRLWVSPSTFRRVLAAHGLVLPEPPGRDPAPRVAWPHWLEWAPNRIWCWDATHFSRAKRVAFAIVDVVSRKWIDTLVSIEETSTQVQVLFDRALLAEGLADLITPERLDLGTDDPERPILLACSDNGPQMTSGATREFFVGLAIAQRLGRPATPTDQAWIESLFGHLKAENPELEQIRDPAALAAELDRARIDYNGTRLHAGIGYVTPNDEHAGRGELIRQARVRGLRRTHEQRSTTTAGTTTETGRKPDDLVDFSVRLRRYVCHRSRRRYRCRRAGETQDPVRAPRDWRPDAVDGRGTPSSWHPSDCG